MTHTVMVPMVDYLHPRWLEKKEAIEDWLLEHTTDLWNYVGTQRNGPGSLWSIYVFEDEQDAMLFRLTWG